MRPPVSTSRSSRSSIRPNDTAAVVQGPAAWHDAAMRAVPHLPRSIGGVPVPQGDIAHETWQWAHRALPAYLLAHSVRAYCWGAAIGADEGLAFDRELLWTASLIHDVGLTRVGRNTMCFEVEGAEFARRFLERRGMPAARAERVAIAIILHMQPGVTLDDGAEPLLLDRATGLDVRGAEFERVDAVRRDVVRAFPRGDFDRRFLAAIEREVDQRPTCQSVRLLNDAGLAARMAESPWRAGDVSAGRSARFVP